MREIKFSYIYQHNETGQLIDLRYTLDEIEKGNAERDKNKRFMDNLIYLRKVYRRLTDEQIEAINKYSLVARRQYSGMKDKKDVEIYEGDIVTGKKRGAPIKGYLKVIDIHWFLHDQEDTFIYFGSVGDLEVIGNIYENPELLGESDEVDKC
jgi:hypothetical protein